MERVQGPVSRETSTLAGLPPHCSSAHSQAQLHPNPDHTFKVITNREQRMLSVGIWLLNECSDVQQAFPVEV